MSDERPKFTFLGHSAIRCELPGGEVVLIDPWLSGNPSAAIGVDDCERVDAILVTHAHFDHLGDTVELAKRHPDAKVVCNVELAHWLRSQGVEAAEMNLGGTQIVHGLRVTMVRADHSSGIRDGDRILPGGPAAGYVVRMPNGYAFYHAGDTALYTDMKLLAELYRPQLAFLPIGDLYTMNPRQAALACRFLGVHLMVPIHWGTFPALTGTPKQLRAELDDLSIRCEVIELQPGDSY